MNFHVTFLKILGSYPKGFAASAELKRDVAILAASGRDWSERTKRIASLLPGLDIFSQGLVAHENGGWRLTESGYSVLAFLVDAEAAMNSVREVENSLPEPRIIDRE